MCVGRLGEWDESIATPCKDNAHGSACLAILGAKLEMPKESGSNGGFTVHLPYVPSLSAQWLVGLITEIKESTLINIRDTAFQETGSPIRILS